MKRRVKLFTLVTQLKCAHVAKFCNYYVDLILHDLTISLHHLCSDIYIILFYPNNNCIIYQFLQTGGVGGVSKFDRTYFIEKEKLLGKGDLLSLLVLAFCTVCSCSLWNT